MHPIEGLVTLIPPGQTAPNCDINDCFIDHSMIGSFLFLTVYIHAEVSCVDCPFGPASPFFFTSPIGLLP